MELALQLAFPRGRGPSSEAAGLVVRLSVAHSNGGTPKVRGAAGGPDEGAAGSDGADDASVAALLGIGDRPVGIE